MATGNLTKRPGSAGPRTGLAAAIAIIYDLPTETNALPQIQESFRIARYDLVSWEIAALHRQPPRAPAFFRRCAIASIGIRAAVACRFCFSAMGVHGREASRCASRGPWRDPRGLVLAAVLFRDFGVYFLGDSGNGAHWANRVFFPPPLAAVSCPRPPRGLSGGCRLPFFHEGRRVKRKAGEEEGEYFQETRHGGPRFWSRPQLGPCHRPGAAAGGSANQRAKSRAAAGAMRSPMISKHRWW